MAEEKKNANNLVLGFHVGKGKTMSVSLQQAASYFKLNAAQIFTHVKLSGKRMKLDDENIKTVCKNISLVVHSAYCTTQIWNSDEAKAAEGLRMIRDHIKRANEIGAWGVVIHTMHVPIDNYIAVMKKLKEEAVAKNVRVIVEMSASMPNDMTFETAAKINKLVEEINAATKTEEKSDAIPWWGICIDTSHIWALEQHIQTREEMNAWLSGLKYPQYIALFHLNGSQNAFHVYKDKHALPFATNDVMWRGIEPPKSAVASVVAYAKKNNICIIIEPHDVESNEELGLCIATIKSLYDAAA